MGEKPKRLFSYTVDTTAMMKQQKNLGGIPSDLFEINKDSCFFNRYDHTDIESSNLHNINTKSFWNACDNNNMNSNNNLLLKRKTL